MLDLKKPEPRIDNTNSIIAGISKLRAKFYKLKKGSENKLFKWEEWAPA